MKALLVIIPLLLFAFNDANKSNYFKILQQRQDPYTFDKKARLELKKAQLEAETKKKIAELDYKKAVDTESIKKEAVVEKAKKEVEREKVAITPKELAVKAKEKMIYYGFILGILLLLVILFIYRRYQLTKERIELEKLQAQKEAHKMEMALKEKEIQANMAGKLIDAIASGNLTKEQEEKLLKLASGTQHLLENKR